MAWNTTMQTSPSSPGLSLHTDTGFPLEDTEIAPSRPTKGNSQSLEQFMRTDKLAFWRGLFWAMLFQWCAVCAAAVIWRLLS